MATVWDFINADDETFVEPPDPAVIEAALYKKRPKKRRIRSLADMTTRHLLAGLQVARRYGGFAFSNLGEFSFEAIKAELAKRPHVPRKPEVKARGERRRPRALPAREPDRDIVGG